MSWEVANYIINKTKENIDELSSKEVNSNDPYTYRQGKGNLADMEIVGASVGWNQLVQNGNFSNGTTNWRYTADYATIQASNNVLTCTNTVDTTLGNMFVFQSNQQSILNHKYLCSFETFIPNTNTSLKSLRGGIRSNAKVVNTTLNKWVKFTDIQNCTQARDIVIISSNSTAAVDDYFQVKNVNVIDLTLLFGSTIADAIYAMEQATAGAGVAFFRKYFPKDYYAYDAGSIQSVCVGSRKVTQFYNFDHSNVLNAYINESTGIITSSSAGSKTVYFYAPTGEYRITKRESSTFRIALYENMPVVGSTMVNGSIVKLTTEKECIYTTNRDGWIAIFCVNSASAYDLENAQRIIDSIEVQKTVATYPFDSTKQLRGMFDLVGGELKASGDKYWSDGNIQRKYGIVDLGTLKWVYQDQYSRLITEDLSSLIKKPSSSSVVSNVICVMYPTVSWSVASRQNKVLSVASSGNVFVFDSAYTDAATFKTAMSGVYLVYELATPTTESAQPYQNPQRAYIDGTEEFTDGLTRDVMIPVGNNTTYQQDKILPSVEDYVDVVAEPKADISAIGTNEDKATASQAYSVGQHFYKDGKFCTAIASIAINSSFTLNTNYVEGTISEAIEGKKAVLDIDPSAATISSYEVGTMWLKTQ